MGLKGISGVNAIYIENYEEFKVKYDIQEKNNEKTLIDSKQAYYIYNKIQPNENELEMLKAMGLTEDEINKEFVEYSDYNDCSLSAPGVLAKFFKELYTVGKSYVLCSQLNKINNNLKHDVSVNEKDKFNNLSNNIRQKIVLKKIIIKEIYLPYKNGLK